MIASPCTPPRHHEDQTITHRSNPPGLYRHLEWRPRPHPDRRATASPHGYTQVDVDKAHTATSAAKNSGCEIDNSGAHQQRPAQAPAHTSTASACLAALNVQNRNERQPG
jgi:hypothetical protein